MGEDPGAARAPLGDDPRGVEEIREDIEQTRAEMGDTVAELVRKADLKARARAQLVIARTKGSALLRTQGMRLTNPAVASAIALPLAGLVVWRRRRRR